MAVVKESQLNLINESVPQLIVVEVEPKPIVRGASTNVVGIVGQFTRGEVGKIYEIGSLSEASRKLGDYLSGLDGHLFLKNFFDGAGGIAHVVRVASTGTAAATGLITDTSTGTAALMSFVFDSVGTHGNATTIKINNSAVSGYFDIQIQNGQEIAVYNKATTLSTDERYIATLVSQDVNRFFTLTMHQTNGTMPASGFTTMSGGSNGTLTGSSLTDSAYVGTDDSNGRTGIEKFEDDDEIIMVVSARSTDTINTALIAHVNQTSVSTRRTIISFAAGTSIDTAVTNMALLDYDKVKVVYPTVKVRNIYSNAIENVSAVSFSAGLDSALTYNLSASQRALPATVLGTEIEFNETEIAKLTKNRINPISKKKGRGVIYRSDYTTSSNPRTQQNFVRKSKDFFIISFDTFMQAFLSKPIDEDLWKDIKSTMETFMGIEATAGRIGRSDGAVPYSVKVDSDNNPPAIVQLNKVIVWTQISLKGVADLIYLYLDVQIDNQNV